MLILTRKVGESILIGDNIRVAVLEVRGRQIRLGIDAPADVVVLREEIAQRLAHENLRAASFNYQEVRQVVTAFEEESLKGVTSWPLQPGPSVVTIESKVLGRISAPEEYIITFSAGLPGYPQERRYALIDSQLEPPFYLLQCVDNATVVFVVADPTKLFPEYHPKTSPVDLQDLQAQSPEDLRVLTILTIPAGRHREITVNLTSPILINPARRLGKQIVIDKPQYSSQYPLTAGNPRPNPKRNDDRENKTS